ncbi:MAG: (S)-ureidoglycine aminohydrolase, partial [Gallicola sp.]|nr:(S)-ureidoglycine aminohydrolase [Gallicola sp.]
MGYLNNNIGYRKDILSNRSVVKKNNYALLEPDGLCKNTIPGFENCEISVLSTPLIGASFVDYIMTVKSGGKNLLGFGGDGVETFIYVLEGELTVNTSEGEKHLTTGGFVFTPADEKLYFENKSGADTRTFLYKRRYVPVEGHSAHLVVGNVSELTFVDYEGMKEVQFTDFLPAASDLGFDMNFHILSFQPGASHGYLETHLAEHGALITEGKGMYNLDNDWMPVKEGDYIYMSAYSLQGAYAVGDKPLTYI